MAALSLGANAQGWKISGSVSDDKGEPLAGAIVVVNSESGQLKSSAATDASGLFSVKAASGDVLEVYISLQALTISAQML